MIKSFSSFLSFCLVLGLSTSSFAAEQCPAISCDCESLPNEQWVEVCTAHEQRIKESCVANSNTPKDYCLVHGLNAKPLPLSIEYSEFSLSEAYDVKDLNKKIAALYWALKTDTDKAIEAFDAANYSRSMKILKLVDTNIDNLFEQQQLVEASLVSLELEGKVRGSWKKYSTDTLAYSQSLNDFGNKIAKMIESAQSSKEQKIFSVLSQQTLRMAGKGFEHAGYAYGKAGKHAKSAKAWSDGAKVSIALSDIAKTSNSKNIRFSEFQAAARLHRASFHWLMTNNLKDSNRSLKESQLYVDRQEQQNIEALVNTIEEKSEGSILTGR